MRILPPRGNHSDMWRLCAGRMLVALLPCVFAGSAPGAIAASFSADRTPAVTGAERLSLWGANSLSQLNATLVGQGVEGTTAASAAAAQGGEIVWRTVRDHTNDLGLRHVFYRQYLRPAASLASLLDEDYRMIGVQIAGATVGIHYNHGEVYAVFGTQFRGVSLLNEPTIGRRADAYALAGEGAARSPGFTPPDAAAVAPPFTEAEQATSKLLLMSAGDGASFRFVWQVPLSDRDGASYAAFLDAGTGTLLSLTRVDVSSSPSCWAKTATQYSATGIAQNDEGVISNRSVWASLQSNHDGFTHEGDHMTADGTIPTIQIFFGTQESNFACNTTTARYGMLPLQTSGGVPTYTNRTDPISVPGKAGGDAIWFTYQTMQTFSELGWYSYDDAGSWANLVVNDLSGDYDNGGYIIPDYPSNYAPTWAVHIGPTSLCKYSYASCLDFVAHEWGHGVVESTANFRYDTTTGAQLHEGFADFLGHAVERYRQPDGSGPEKRDWLFGEDNRDLESGSWVSYPRRRVDVFECVTTPCTSPYTPKFSALFHRLQSVNDTDAHDRGNMLGVAFRLLAEGGSNPICDWPPWDGTDCDIDVNQVGLTGATRILFRTLTVYAYDTMGWGDLADLAKAAAFDLYSGCPLRNGGAQQTAANRAFGAIGYPGSAGYYQCP
jgi:Thermolysin metallopeptidase, alpha-helical domain